VATEEKVTFCRICEALCGMVATVEDGRVVQLRPDREHPLSRGYACPKGIAMAQVQNDPDRVLHPLRRVGGPGEFERVSWDEALGDIATRLKGIPGRTVGWYFGNPGAFSYSHPLWVKGMLDALGSPHLYSAGSQDVNNRFAASALLYGTPLIVPIPDLNRTRMLLMVGANPLVSHGSVLTTPRIRERLHEIERVVVVDPRRTETARAFEHVPIRPDTDAWLLLSLLQVIFEEGLADEDAMRRQAVGAGALRSAARTCPPEATAARTGIPAERVRELARALAASEGAAVYGRTGSCLGRYGTLVAYLLDALNVVTGNLDAPGGAVFGRPPVALDEIADRAGQVSYGTYRTRVGGFPDVLGNLPATLLHREIADGEVRALFVSAGNPVLSVPDGEALVAALPNLDLHVSMDFYVNESNRHADYVLPSTTFLEREDLPAAFFAFQTTPYAQWTEPVVEPAGEARQEWEIIDAIARRIGVVPSSVPLLRALRLRVKPRWIADALLRTGPARLSVAKLRRHPHGLVLGENPETGVLAEKVRHPDGRVRLDPPEILGELRRLRETGDEADDDAFPLRLIGMRELRSHNSWMHNAPLLLRGGRTHALRVHPDDAAAHGLSDGAPARVTSKSGSLEVAVLVTDEMTPGTVALPHGWGHHGGWRNANDLGGANSNVLASAEPEDLEPLAGMAFLNGIAVRAEPVRAAVAAGSAAAAPAPSPR
jgi:anaerobic selenocysteine-containing dehydrogenase